MSASEEEPHVTSEINTFLSSTSEVQPLSKSSNKVAKLIFSLPKSTLVPGVSSSQEEVDKDGDLIVKRKHTHLKDMEESAMYIEYENSTTLKSVGLQIWRGAFLLGDFILQRSQEYFQGKNVLELGSGTGLTAIVAALYAKKVYATDLDDAEILKLIQCNVKHNEKFIKCDEFRVKPLDFTNSSWAPDVEQFVAEADTIIAADVVYSVRINQAFVLTLKKILSSGRKPKTIFIAMEKRYVFTIDDLSSLAPLYLDFLERLERTLNISKDSPFSILKVGDSSIKLSMEQIPIDSCSQYFNYEKTKELVLWQISSSFDLV